MTRDESDAYQFFISYAVGDGVQTARALRRAVAWAGAGAVSRGMGLLGLRRPPIRVFCDEDQAVLERDLGGRLEQAAQAAETFVLVISPAAAESRWVDRECAVRVGSGREIELVSAVDEVKWTARGPVDAVGRPLVPSSLQEHFGNRPEPQIPRITPVGTGLRRSDRGLASVAAKLASEVVGKSPSALLVEWERARRTSTWVVVAVVVALATALLATALALREADANLQLARDVQADAIEAIQASFVEVSQGLRGYPEHDALRRSQRKKGSDLLASLESASVRLETPARRRTAMMRLLVSAEEALRSGDGASALAFAARAEPMASAALANAPSDEQHRDAVVMLPLTRGRALSLIGMGAEAVDAIRSAVAGARSRADAPQSTPRAIADLALTLESLGDAERSLQDLAATRSAWEEAVAARSLLLESEPDDVEHLTAAGVALSKLAQLELGEGRCDVAERLLRRSHGLRSQAAEESGSTLVQTQLAVAEELLGEHALTCASADEALRHHQRALELRRAVSTRAADSARAELSVLVSLLAIADTAVSAGNSSLADSSSAEALALAGRLEALVPDDLEVSRRAGAASQKRARVLAASGRPADALVVAGRAVKVAREVWSRTTDRRAGLALAGALETYSVLGTQAGGRPEDQADLLEEAAGIYGQLAAASPSDVEISGRLMQVRANRIATLVRGGPAAQEEARRSLGSLQETITRLGGCQAYLPLARNTACAVMESSLP